MKKVLIGLTIIASCTMVLSGCSSPTEDISSGSSDTTGPSDSGSNGAVDPLSNISVVELNCMSGYWEAEATLQNNNATMYDVGITIAFKDSDGTVIETSTEYPSLLGNAKTKVTIKRNTDPSSCEVGSLTLLTPQD
jgi:uncharacterized protein YcfL